MSKTYGEQIAEMEAARAAKAARMESITEKAMEEGRTKDAAEKEEFATLRDEIKALDEELVDLREMEKLAAQKAVPAAGATQKEAGASREGVTVKHRENLEPGIEFARHAMCVAAAKGMPGEAFRLAQTYYPNSERVVNALKMQAERGSNGIETLMKANVAAGTTSDSTWAGPLVQYQNYAGDFIEYLRPQTILGKFGTGNIPGLNRIPFNVRIAGQTSGGTGYWVGEGKPTPLTKYDFTTVTLQWAKVGAISVLTEETMRFADPSAERLVRDSLAASLIAKLDVDFVDPTKAAVANVSPASITNGVTELSSSGSDADAVRADIRALFAPFIAANNPPSQAVLIMTSTTALALSLMLNALGQPEFPNITMNGGTLLGIPVIVSEYLDNSAGSAGGLVILVNARDIYLADDGQVTIDVSREASLQMLDNPTNDTTTPTATTMVSMFQTDCVALRAHRFINWSKRRSTAVSYLGSVTWGQ